MKNMTLVIMAAGMGSRFGGLKQVTPMGPNDEFIIDYSIYDAIKAGFNKVVFIIKKENEELFKNTIGNRVEKHVHVEYAFQTNNNLPIGYILPKDRVKPLGTAHAILCAKNYVHEPFAVINSDDFYGRDAFMVAANYLQDMKNDKPIRYGMVGYMVKNTMTINGSVKRGICETEDNMLTDLIESSIEYIENKIVASPLNGSEKFEVSSNATVSMNLFLFNPTIFDYIENKFSKFLDDNKDNMEKCEYLIPDVVFNSIKEGASTMEVLKTNATWHGVTYKEDTNFVKTSLKQLHDIGEYPDNLW